MADNPSVPFPWSKDMQEKEPVSSLIRDMPSHLRPREKMAAFGAGALDNAELMALFISTGTKGRSAIDIGRALLSRYGSLAAVGMMPVAELAKEKGLGLAKASKLVAAFELGSRVSREQSRELPLDTPTLIYETFGPQLCHLAHEQVLVATLDARLRHIGTTSISQGSLTASEAHPREVLRPVITRGAYGFVLIHNHPSGDPSPSRADEQITRTLVDLAKTMQVHFFDHIIIGRPSEGRPGFYSFRAAGIIG